MIENGVSDVRRHAERKLLNTDDLQTLSITGAGEGVTGKSGEGVSEVWSMETFRHLSAKRIDQSSLLSPGHRQKKFAWRNM